MKIFDLKKLMCIILFAFTSSLKAHVLDFFSFFMGLSSFKLSCASVLGILFFFSPEWLRDRAWPVSKKEFQNFTDEIEKSQKTQFEQLREIRKKGMETLEEQGKKLENQVNNFDQNFKNMVQKRSKQDEEVGQAISGLGKNIKIVEAQLKKSISEHYQSMLEEFKKYQSNIAQQLENIQKHEDDLVKHFNQNFFKLSDQIQKNYQKELQQLNEAQEKLQREQKKVKEQIRQLQIGAQDALKKQFEQQQVIEQFSRLFNQFAQSQDERSNTFNQDLKTLQLVLDKLTKKNKKNNKFVKNKLLPKVNSLNQNAHKINEGMNFMVNLKNNKFFNQVRTITSEKKLLFVEQID
jgi:chromosome segregation ATPase